MSTSRTITVNKDNWVMQRVGSTVKYGNGTTPRITIGPTASATDATILYKGRGLYSFSAADMLTLLTGLGSLSVATADFVVANTACASRGTAQKIYLEEVTGDFTTNTTTSDCQLSTSGGASAVWPGPAATTVNRVLKTASGLSTADPLSFNILPLLQARLAAGNFGAFRFRLIAANTTGGYDEANHDRTVTLYGSASTANKPSISITGELAATNVSAAAGTATGSGTAYAPSGVGSTATVSKLFVDGEFGVISMRAMNDIKYATLDGISTEDVESTLLFKLDKLPTGDLAIIRLLGRYIDINNHYRHNVRISPDGSVLLRINKKVAGVTTTLVSQDAGLTLEAGSIYLAKFYTKGTAPCTLSGKLYRQGTSEPDWQLSTTDSAAALQANSTIGVGAEVDSVTNLPIEFRVDEFSAVAV